MTEPSKESAMDAVLLPNGDVHAAQQHTYYLGTIHRSGRSAEGQPLVAEIDIAELGEPTVPILQSMGWRVRVVAGQGREPVQGRFRGVQCEWWRRMKSRNQAFRLATRSCH